jgi:hypothetical protein
MGKTMPSAVAKGPVPLISGNFVDFKEASPGGNAEL